MTFPTDITGYGRKMGRDAGLNSEGRMEGVHYLGPVSDGLSGWMPSGSISARTMNPGGSEVSGGGARSGDYAPSYGRNDGIAGNPRGPPAMNDA